MGEGLFDQYPDLTAAADAELGYSLKALCLEDSARLRDTRYAQPAVFFVNALSALRALGGRDGEYGSFIGHSLGEYNALVAAGCLDLMTALRLVRDRAEAMARVKNGGMAAVTGLTAERIEQLLREANLVQVFVANRNSERQTVIAGSSLQLGLAVERLKAAGARGVVPLPVSGPFHTPLMAPAARAYAAALRACEFKPAHTPVYSSATGVPFDFERAVTVLSSQITGPVDWVRAVRRLRGDGVTQFDEVNGTTLTALVRTIR
jgi:malonyl CoA-acyl carrier protein transacylase